MTDRFEPAVGCEARALLRRVRILANRHAVADELDRDAMRAMIQRGYIQHHGPNRSLLSLTAKGERFLDRLVRCE